MNSRSNDTPITALPVLDPDGHLTPQALAAYREGNLAPEALLDADDHLSVCPDCRRAAWAAQAESAPTDAAAPLHSLATAFNRPEAQEGTEADGFADDPHMTYGQMEAYVEGTLGDIDREIAEGHLLFCDRCVEEVRDLRAFRAERTTYPAREYTPEPMRPWWSRLLAPFAALPPAGRMGLSWAAAGLAGVAIVTAATQPLQRDVAELRTQTAARQAEDARQITDLQTRLAQAEQTRRTAQGETVASAEAATKAQKTVEELRRQVAILKQQKANPTVPGPDAGPQDRAPSLPAQAAVVARISDGGRTAVQLRKDGTVEGLPKGTSPVLQRNVASALRTGKLTPPEAVQSLIGARGVLLSPESGDPGSGPRLLAPVGTRILAPRPVFRWSAVEGASGYRIAVYNAADFSKVAESPLITGKAAWQPETPLPRGEVLSWQITTIFPAESGLAPRLTPEPPAPEAKFTVLPESDTRALTEKARTAGTSPLLRAVLYAQYGLLDDAEQATNALVAANPGDKLARKLQESLRTLRYK